ncbi:hypothetical protein ACN47A_06755 [Myxococcus fulvus]|uniref:hypothetical protein n=1 Tax=Myxococcus fulvus TaxID=33 RepID=UPI003B9DA00A
MAQDIRSDSSQGVTGSMPATTEAEAGQATGKFPPESYPTKSIEQLLGRGKTRADLVFPDVHNDYELDNALIGQTVTNNGCIVKSDWISTTVNPDTLHLISGSMGGQRSTKEPSDPAIKAQVAASMKPIAAYLAYIKKDSVPSGVQEGYTLRKKKGFSRQFTTSTEVKSSVTAGFMACEATLEVTTSFSYSETIEEEVEETWTKTLTGPQDYWTFQPVVIYAIRIPKWRSNFGGERYGTIGPYYFFRNDNAYSFMPLFRNSPSTLDREIGYLSLQTVAEYLQNEAWGRW